LYKHYKYQQKTYSVYSSVFQNYKHNQIIIMFFELIKEIKLKISNKLLVFRLNDLISSIRNKKIEFVLLSMNPNRTDLILWVPILCRMFSIPYLLTGNKNKLPRMTSSKKQLIFALKVSIDSNIKYKQKLVEMLKILNQPIDNSTLLKYY